MSETIQGKQKLSDFALKELCFEITSDCLLRCCFCSTFNDRDRKISSFYIDVDVFEDVVEDFRRLGGEILEISGGEPLLHPSITKLVWTAKDKGLQVRLYTSGVTRLDATRLVRDLAGVGLDRIIFNCQGLTRKHDILVGTNGAFKRMLETLKGSKDAGLWVGVHTIPMRPNISQIVFLYRLFSKHGVNEMAFLRLVKQGRATLNWSLLALEPDDYKQFIDVVLRLLEELTVTRLNESTGTKLRLGCPFQVLRVHEQLWDVERGESHCCHAGRHSLNILPDGSVIPCPAFKDVSSARLGNIFKDSLEKIWQSSIFLQRLRQPLSVSHCISCDFWNECRGGCAAQRFITYHELTKGPDPLCQCLGVHREQYFFEKSSLDFKRHFLFKRNTSLSGIQCLTGNKS